MEHHGIASADAATLLLPSRFTEYTVSIVMGSRVDELVSVVDFGVSEQRTKAHTQFGHSQCRCPLLECTAMHVSKECWSCQPLACNRYVLSFGDTGLSQAPSGGIN